MLSATLAYLTEEAKLRGAEPQVRAVISPAGGSPVEVPVNKIIKAGTVTASAPFFQISDQVAHQLLVDNRDGAFNPGAPGCPLQPGQWFNTQIQIDFGFKTDSGTEWLNLYTGTINKLNGISHGWGQAHNAQIRSTSPISIGLKKKIGVPTADGTRRPFMAGTYLANAELDDTLDPYLGAVTKTGTGSATLTVLGADRFTSSVDLKYRVTAEVNGEIGVATFKWSNDGGMTWEKAGIVTASILEPVTLANGLKVFWSGGSFVAGDYWDFTAYAKVYKFIVFGAPFTAITNLYLNGEDLVSGYTADPTTGIINLTGKSGTIKARVYKDENHHPVDQITAILTEVGLENYIDQASFAETKDATSFYNLGIRFENIAASRAVSTLIATALYSLWIENDLIKLRAWDPTPNTVTWERSTQFNWLWDNMGGSDAYQPVCGALSGATATVQADGTVHLTGLPGNGKCAFVRGVWLASTVFTYEGLWANPESGDATNYYTRGSFANVAGETIITLGSALAEGTQVQIYYFYDLETPCQKYDGMNNYPCPRKAYRSASDFSYDYAPDRIMDLMRILHTAQLLRGVNYGDCLSFLWNKFMACSASPTNPLFQDDYERSIWDRGPHPIYKDSTLGEAGFEYFGTELYPGDQESFINLPDPRVLKIALAKYSTSTFGAWWGYGLNWDLSLPAFAGVNQVSFQLRTPVSETGVVNVVKQTYLGSNATLIVQDRGGVPSSHNIVIQITSTANIGTATYQWSKDGGVTWEATGLVTGDKDHPANLIDNIYIWWEGTSLVNGETWFFRTQEVMIHPRRLLLTLNDSTLSTPDPWTEAHTFYHALVDKYDTLTPVTIPFTQFWRRDNIVYDGDRRKASWSMWYSATYEGDTQMIIGEHEEDITLDGKTFHTQLQIETVISPYTTAWGGWTGLNTSEVNSTGHTNINLAVYHQDPGATTIRVKVKDANGSYFHQDFSVNPNTWTRLTATLASMTLESGSAPLVHPLQVVDVGVPSSPLRYGTYRIADVKFDDHQVFAGPNIRTVEFKYLESTLALPQAIFWIDGFGLNLEADDPYPYVPHLSMSIGPYGQIFYRGPTLVHYADPLAPHLMGETAIEATNVAFHVDAQAEFHTRYGTLGPIMPVHTRTDVENIADLGCENFNKFCWWPDYPETTNGLGQYWAFMRLAAYYFFTGNAPAWTVLDNWLTWFDTYGIADGSSWKFPHNFADSGVTYGSYDAGETASIAIGCLYIYMRNQDTRANIWARRILDDLRLNRQSPDYQYLYKSDFHHVWMQALVAHAFGLAVSGRPGQLHTFPSTTDDQDHFDNMVSTFMAMAGDSKPNVLNADLIPFSNVEDNDSWEYAPAYMTNKEAGSVEALVMMLDVAMDKGNWSWFDTLLDFVLRNRMVSLPSLESVTTSLMTSHTANIVRVVFGDFMRNNAYYKEAKNAAIITEIGELPQEVDLRYGNPVITEDPATAQDLADRGLEFATRPIETAVLRAWMEGARIEVGDIVPVTSEFHGLDQDEFICTAKSINLDQNRVTLTANRHKDLT